MYFYVCFAAANWTRQDTTAAPSKGFTDCPRQQPLSFNQGKEGEKKLPLENQKPQNQEGSTSRTDRQCNNWVCFTFFFFFLQNKSRHVAMLLLEALLTSEVLIRLNFFYVQQMKITHVLFLIT